MKVLRYYKIEKKMCILFFGRILCPLKKKIVMLYEIYSVFWFQKKHPKLYRLLRENENKNIGLKAKFPFSNISVAHHVAYGSKGKSSKYISTCSSPYAAYNLLELKRSRGSNRNRNNNDKIVEIDVNRLPSNVSIIDLTSEELREPYEVRDEETNRKFHKFAQKYREVLLVGNIPANCLQYY